MYDKTEDDQVNDDDDVCSTLPRELTFNVYTSHYGDERVCRDLIPTHAYTHTLSNLTATGACVGVSPLQLYPLSCFVLFMYLRKRA